jgi:predicted nucleic acid-binding protein
MEVSAEQQGAGFVCFDTTALLAFARVGAVDLLGEWFPQAFVPNVVMEEEIAAHVSRYPENQAIVDANWLSVIAVEEDDDLKLVAYLLEERWASEDDKDRGEAEVIALCRRNGWLAILDDSEGRRAAADEGVRHISFLGVIVGAAAQAKLNPNDAWELHVKIDEARKGSGLGSFSFLTSDPSMKPIFLDAINDVRRRWIADERKDWHAILLLDDRPIDETILSLRRAAAGRARR